MADLVIYVPRFTLTKNTKPIRQTSLETVATEHWFFRTLRLGQHLVLYVIIKQFSRDIYSVPVCLSSRCFWYALSSHAPIFSKDNKCNLEHFYKARKASQSFPSSAILRSQYYYTHVLEVNAWTWCLLLIRIIKKSSTWLWNFSVNYSSRVVSLIHSSSRNPTNIGPSSRISVVLPHLLLLVLVSGVQLHAAALSVSTQSPRPRVIAAATAFGR